MKKQKKQEELEPIKVDGVLSSEYAPIEEWSEAEAKYGDLPLNEGEYTKIIIKNLGICDCYVARFKNLVRSHSYLDGVEFKTNLKEVTPLEIEERRRENEKFL